MHHIKEQATPVLLFIILLAAGSWFGMSLNRRVDNVNARLEQIEISRQLFKDDAIEKTGRGIEYNLRSNKFLNSGDDYYTTPVPAVVMLGRPDARGAALTKFALPLESEQYRFIWQKNVPNGSQSWRLWGDTRDKGRLDISLAYPMGDDLGTFVNPLRGTFMQGAICTDELRDQFYNEIIQLKSHTWKTEQINCEDVQELSVPEELRGHVRLALVTPEHEIFNRYFSYLFIFVHKFDLPGLSSEDIVMPFYFDFITGHRVTNGVKRDDPEIVKFLEEYPRFVARNLQFHLETRTGETDVWTQ